MTTERNGDACSADSRGDLLREVRVQLGNPSQENFGKIICPETDVGSLKDTISRWECGKRKISDKKLIEIVGKLKSLKREINNKSSRLKKLGIDLELFEDPTRRQSLTEAIAAVERTRSKNIPSNLPKVDYEFVGRNEEKGQLLKDLDLSPNSRPSLLNITGSRGVGKSALAIEVANQCKKFHYFDAIVWYPPKGEESSNNEYSNNNITLNNKTIPNFEELLVTIIKVLNPQPLPYKSSPSDNIKIAKKLLSQQRTLLIVDGLETIDDERVMEYINSLPATNKVLTTDRRGDQHTLASQILLSGLPKDKSIELINNCKCKVELDEQEQNYIAEIADGIPYTIKWIIEKISSKYWHIDDLSKHLSSGKCFPLSKYLFQRSYDQLSPRSKKILCSLSLLPVPVTGNFLLECNKIVRNEARDSFLQLLGHWFILKKGDPNLKWSDQIYGMSHFAKDFSRYQKDYSTNELKTHIISHVFKQLHQKMYNFLTKRNLKKVQEFVDENSELLAWAIDDLNKLDHFKKLKLLAPEIKFPKGFMERIKEM